MRHQGGPHAMVSRETVGRTRCGRRCHPEPPPSRSQRRLLGARRSLHHCSREPTSNRHPCACSRQSSLDNARAAARPRVGDSRGTHRGSVDRNAMSALLDLRGTESLWCPCGHRSRLPSPSRGGKPRGLVLSFSGRVPRETRSRARLQRIEPPSVPDWVGSDAWYL